MYTYRVVFSGDIAKDRDQAEVEQALAKRFGLSEPEKIRRMFSGVSVTLRKGLSQRQSNQFRAEMAAMGLLCRLEVEPHSEPPVVEAPPPRDSVSPVSAAAVSRDNTAVTDELQAGGEGVTSLDDLSLSLVPLGEVPVSNMPEPDVGEVDPRFQARELRTRENSAPTPVASATRAKKPVFKSKKPAGASTEDKDKVAAKGAQTGGAGKDKSSEQVVAVSGLCWGGFFFGWLWGIFNNTWISLLTLVPIINLPMMFVLLVKGRQWAWENKSWSSLEHFNRVQRRWTIAGLIVFGIVITAIALAVALPLAANY